MMQRFAVMVLVLSFAAAVHAREPLRLDGSSAQAAESSWKAMTDSVSDAKKQKLLVAVIKINLAGVQSAHEVVADPGLQNLGIARIRAKVSGMTADEIIDLGERVGTVRIESSGR
jgi:hypothetical protein